LPRSALARSGTSRRRPASLELLRVLREAMGFALPEPEDRMREDELRVVSLIQKLATSGSPTSVLVRLTRVYGDALRRIAEVEADWWHTYVVLPSLASGMTEAEMHEATLGFGVELAPLLEAGDPGDLPRAPGAHVDREPDRGDRGRTRPHRTSRSPGRTAGDLLPRHHRLHAAHRGTRRRGGDGAGGSFDAARPAAG
jgi:hypothetical protein